MRDLKIVGAGLLGLLAVGTLFSLGGSSSHAIGDMAPRILAVIVFGALAVFLWRGGTRRAPRQ